MLPIDPLNPINPINPIDPIKPNNTVMQLQGSTRSKKVTAPDPGRRRDLVEAPRQVTEAVAARSRICSTSNK